MQLSKKVLAKVLNVIIVLMFVLSFLTFSTAVFADEYRGKAKTGGNALICLSFSDYTDAMNAVKARANDLVMSYLDRSCMFLKPDVEVIVVDGNERWYEIRIKGNDGNFVKAYVHPALVTKVDE